MAQQHRAGNLGLGVILLIQNCHQRGRPVASRGGVRDVTERPWNEVIEYYCFLIIIIVGTPYFRDPVWQLKCTPFSELYAKFAPV